MVRKKSDFQIFIVYNFLILLYFNFIFCEFCGFINFRHSKLQTLGTFSRFIHVRV